MLGSEPNTANHWQLEHLHCLHDSLRALNGSGLPLPGALDATMAAWVYREAPFVLLSHNTAADPIFTYANRTAQTLFEMDWPAITALPSRHSAEAPSREERAELLARVREHGWIDDYSGVRIASSGQRFRIAQAVVWNLRDADGAYCGQAAMFDQWQPIEPGSNQ